jgi:hypothetical protein
MESWYHLATKGPSRNMGAVKEPKAQFVSAMVTLVGITAAACGGGSTSSPTTTKVAPPTTAVAATTLPPSTTQPAPTTTTLAGPSPCTSNHLSLSQGPGQGGSGSYVVQIIFTNTGTVPCTLQGYPGVSAVVANGVQLGTPAGRIGSATPMLVSLEPNQLTQATLTYRSPFTGCNNPVLGLGVRVYPPNQTAALFLALNGIGECPGADVNLSVYSIGDNSLAA